MCNKQKRTSYIVSFKINVIKYAKQHGNRAAERRFGPLPTEKICECREREKNYRRLGRINTLLAQIL
jgi:hypothetical protein